MFILEELFRLIPSQHQPTVPHSSFDFNNENSESPPIEHTPEPPQLHPNNPTPDPIQSLFIELPLKKINSKLMNTVIDQIIQQKFGKYFTQCSNDSEIRLISNRCSNNFNFPSTLVQALPSLYLTGSDYFQKAAQSILSFPFKKLIA
jgi:hypothetical protein